MILNKSFCWMLPAAKIMNCAYRPGVEPWRAGCRAWSSGRAASPVTGANDGGYRRDRSLCVTENLSLLTESDATICHAIKDAVPPEFAQSVASARYRLWQRPEPRGAGQCMGFRWRRSPLVSDDVSQAVAALFAGRDVWDLH